MSVNKVFLIGSVGKNPEVVTLQNGTKIAKFSIATTHSQKNATGTYEKITTWHNVVFFGRVVDVVEKYVQKGSSLCIEGRISNRQYEKDGVTKYFTEIIGDNLTLLGKKSDNENSTDNNTDNRTAEELKATNDAASEIRSKSQSENPDELPF